MHNDQQQAYQYQSSMSRAPVSYPPYYFTERNTYTSTPGILQYDKGGVVLERYKPKFGPCLIVLAVLFILLILAIIVCLFIFFTWGATYIGDSRVHERGGYQVDLELARSIAVGLNNNVKYCILDVAFLAPNYAQLYAEEHLPNARHFDIAKVVKRQQNGSQIPIPPMDFQNYARSLGVTKDCYIIIYDHGEASDSVIAATYAWYLFKLHGHNKVTVMNGGLKAWRTLVKEFPQYKTTDKIPEAAKDGDFIAGWNPKLWHSFEDVQSALQSSNPPVIADAREPDYYRGTKNHQEAKEAGRIKGAVNAPVSEMLSPEDGGLRILPDLKVWMGAKGLGPGQSVVAYSNSGLHASLLYFVMVQAGWDAKLYNNGWVEWSYRAPAEWKERG